jgi:hypothetical protein
MIILWFGLKVCYHSPCIFLPHLFFYFVHSFPLPSSLPLVYTQRLTHIQQVVCGPVIQTLEEQLQRTQSSLEDLRHKKTQLKLKLEQAEQTRPQKMNISEV